MGCLKNVFGGRHDFVCLMQMYICYSQRLFFQYYRYNKSKYTQLSCIIAHLVMR